MTIPGRRLSFQRATNGRRSEIGAVLAGSDWGEAPRIVSLRIFGVPHRFAKNLVQPVAERIVVLLAVCQEMPQVGDDEAVDDGADSQLVG